MAELEVTPVGNGAYRVTGGAQQRIAYAAASLDGQWVFLDGRVYVVEDAGSTRALPHRSNVAPKRRTPDADALASPMPATVVSITVAPGQRVSKGDVLVMLEAMKMELPIKAPRDGVIKAIACSPGELVQPGIPLLELE